MKAFVIELNLAIANAAVSFPVGDPIANAFTVPKELE